MTPEELAREREASRQRQAVLQQQRAAEWARWNTPYQSGRFGDLSRKKPPRIPMHDEYLPPREWAEVGR